MLFKCLMGLFPCVGAVCLCCSNREEIVIWLLKTGCCPSSSTTLHLHPTLLPLSYYTVPLNFELLPWLAIATYPLLVSRESRDGIWAELGAASPFYNLNKSCLGWSIAKCGAQNCQYFKLNSNSLVHSVKLSPGCGLWWAARQYLTSREFSTGCLKKKGDVPSNGHNFSEITS